MRPSLFFAVDRQFEGKIALFAGGRGDTNNAQQAMLRVDIAGKRTGAATVGRIKTSVATTGRRLVQRKLNDAVDQGRRPGHRKGHQGRAQR